MVTKFIRNDHKIKPLHNKLKFKNQLITSLLVRALARSMHPHAFFEEKFSVGDSMTHTLQLHHS